MRVLVTGGAGFIGSAACRGLVAGAGWTVLNLDKLTYAASEESLAEIAAHPRYRFVQGDICDAELVRRLLADFAPDAILHLAAESHVDRSIVDAADFVQTNVAGAHCLLEAALRYWQRLSGEGKARFRFLHVSTDEVFGELEEAGHFTESSPYAPRSPYSASKAAADHLVRAWGVTHRLPVLISNCSNNYGPFQFPEKLVPLTLINALEGRRVGVYGDGRHVRDWLHVDDHVSALKLMLEHAEPGTTYVVGGRSERRNIDVVYAICDLLDELVPDETTGPRRALVDFVPDRPGHDRRYAVNCARIETELGWRPQRTFEQGLRETVIWYLANRNSWGPLRAPQHARDRQGLRAAG
jgi:dTDP-glucose 4,6-dehydratase